LPVFPLISRSATSWHFSSSAASLRTRRRITFERR
jgi:hypothetical protein